jgi:hypothetical protein
MGEMTSIDDIMQAPGGANQPSQLLMAEVVNAYLAEHAPTKPSKGLDRRNG